MKKSFFIFGLSLVFSSNLLAGSFYSLNVKDGLSSRQVYRICKDSIGFLWTCTYAGIDRYDGNEIRHYTLDEADNSKEYVHAYSVMVCDRSGFLWVALKNGKVYAYDKQSDSFLLQINLRDHLSSAELNSILFDHENRLWICLSDGIYCWNKKKGLKKIGLKGQKVQNMVQLDNNVFLVNSDKGLWKLSVRHTEDVLLEKKMFIPKEIRIESLFVHHGKLFIGSFSKGIFMVDLSNEQVCHLNSIDIHSPIISFAKLPDGCLLVGSDGDGVYSIDASTGKILKHFKADGDENNSLADNKVSDICVDEYGCIWVSTFTGGVSYFHPSKPAVSRTVHERNNPQSLKSSHVNVVFQDSDGDCWYGTNNGVSLLLSESGKWIHFLSDSTDSSSVVLALAEDAKGYIWVGGYGIGVYRIHKKTRNIKKWERREGDAGIGVGTDYIYAILADGNHIWLGGIEGELTCYNIDSGKYTYYPLDCVGDIQKGKDNSLLIAGCNGLSILDIATGSIRLFQQLGKFTLTYPIRCLRQSASGDIWLATSGNGLICFNLDKQEAFVYNVENGLSSNVINSLLEDISGNIWFTTEKDLYYLNQKNKVLVQVNDLLGIECGDYNPNAAVRLNDGSFSVGTMEGVITFIPTLDIDCPISTKLILTDFRILYETVKAGEEGSLLENNINDTQSINLEYNQNSFSISFSAIDFLSSHRIKYEYKLEKYSSQWESLNSVGNVDFMNLSPGKYIFKLRALDKYNGRKVAERNLEIVIHSSCWLSWYAFLIYILLFSVLVYMLVQYEKHKYHENKVNEKLRFFISLAHDIRTPVALIKAPLSELEMMPNLSVEGKKTVELASKNVDKLLSMISQLLNLQKVELHSECLKISRCDIKSYLDERLKDYCLVAKQKNIGLKLEIDEDMSEVWIDEEKMDHIIDNLLSNALKYTEHGVVHIMVRDIGKKWGIEVKDTGIGIPRKDQRNIFHEYFRAHNTANLEETGSGIGLMITRRLVKQHKGTISFTSVEGKGSIFTAIFPKIIKTGVIVVPRADKLAVTSSVVDHQNSADDVEKNVLLLAEDDLDMREYLTNSLSVEYKVIGVSDGGKALEMAREINPDIIISDVIMPVLEGDELCRILKSSVDTSHIPIILLTALSERENIIFGLEAGANDYIVKPFDLSVLKVRIRNILQNRQRLRETVLSMDTQPEEEDYTSQLDKEFLDRVMAIVQEELSNTEFSINDFCRLIGMSRTSFYNKIKTLTGQGPNDFIRIVRLNKAKELLISHRYSIGEVANMVGFSDSKYFSTCFKKQFGTSPSKI